VNRASWIPRGRLAALPVAHAWNDENPYNVIPRTEDALIRRCEHLSFRAQAAFVLACTEWVLGRFEGVFEDPLVDSYVEALWAAVVDPKFATFLSDFPASDEGPVRGPIAVAVSTATDMFRGCDHRDAAFMVTLVRHVTGRDVAFEEWLEAILERLERLHPRGSEGAVARELFGIDLAADEESRLVRRFLRQLDAGKNRYLVPARH
jgi:hypothetical protein